MQDSNLLLFKLDLAIKNQGARWASAPTGDVSEGEAVIGVIEEGSEIRSYYSFGRWLNTLIRDLSVSPAEYDLLPFEERTAHDLKLLPLTTAMEAVNRELWQKIYAAFPATIHNMPSVRLCVDWQVVMSPEPNPSIPRGKDGLPCVGITKMVVQRMP